MSSKKNQVRFKVGGFVYYSDFDVVMNFPDSTLQELCRASYVYWVDGQYESREVVIERDGRHFGAILKHLRGDALKLFRWNDIELGKLRREAEYYGLLDLAQDCVTEQSTRREEQGQPMELEKPEEQKKKVEPKGKKKVVIKTTKIVTKVKKGKSKSLQVQQNASRSMVEKNTQAPDCDDTSENTMTYQQSHGDLFFNIQPALDSIRASGKLGIVADFEVLDLLDDVNNICQLCHPIKVYLARLPTLIILYSSDLKKLMISQSGDDDVVVTKESQMNALRNFLDNLKTQYINKLYLRDVS